MRVQEMCHTGMKVGLLIAIAPTLITALTVPVPSKLALFRVTASVALRILTGNAFAAQIKRFAAANIPLLWKISVATAVVGGAIVALSVTVAVIDSLYRCCVPSKPRLAPPN